MAYAVEYQDGSPFEQKLLILDPEGQVAKVAGPGLVAPVGESRGDG